MRKLELRDWAAIAEIVGTVAVVISLLFVAQSLDRNTATVSSASTDGVLDALREVELSVMNNPELLYAVMQGRDSPQDLTAQEKELYTRYVVIYIDEWDKIDARERLGLLREENLEGWHPYFESWVQRHVTRELWDGIKWNWDSPFIERVTAAISD